MSYLLDYHQSLGQLNWIEEENSITVFFYSFILILNNSMEKGGGGGAIEFGCVNTLDKIDISFLPKPIQLSE